MTHNPWIYIFIMAAVSYAIRCLPMTLIRKPIKSRFIQSFLYYVPYVTLAVMTFPAIVEATPEPHFRCGCIDCRLAGGLVWRKSVAVRGLAAVRYCCWSCFSFESPFDTASDCSGAVFSIFCYDLLTIRIPVL